MVANIGGAGFLECAVNAATYLQAGLANIPGVGVDPVCFSTPNIARVNTGPFVGFAVMLRYASSLPSGARLCLVNFELPNFATRTKKCSTRGRTAPARRWC